MEQKTMSISKARNILDKRKLNYWKLYHERYINPADDRVVAEYNTAEMYELEAEDYADDYDNREIQALETLANYHTERGKRLEKLNKIFGL